MSPLTAIGLGTVLFTMAGVLTDRLPIGTADGLAALGVASIALGRMGDSPLSAVVNSALAAHFAYRWWNGRDGRGGPRRRLRAGLRRFLGRRRTAPSQG
ncbi:hypothetical protein [Streptomyces sp. NPDC097610]|uniref:hypothetical protein n=1 Tax=Streptomyces sp. NPDC097610 TaxID=3157227 RepID=UPI003333AA00